MGRTRPIGINRQAQVFLHGIGQHFEHIAVTVGRGVRDSTGQ